MDSSAINLPSPGRRRGRYSDSGACQDSCRLIHARRGVLFSADAVTLAGSESCSGLSLTTAM